MRVQPALAHGYREGREGRLVTTAAALVGMFVAMFVGLSPQTARAHDDGSSFHMEHHCLQDTVCLFEARNYDHSIYINEFNNSNYYVASYHFSDDGHSHRVNDTASSVDNDGGSCGTSHYEHAYYSGQAFWLPRGDAVANLGGSWFGGYFNNRLSSHQWCVFNSASSEPVSFTGLLPPPTLGESTESVTGIRVDLPEIVGGAQRVMILLERAENVLIAQCMADAGFDHFAPTDTDVDAYIYEEQTGVLTPEVADREGYGVYLSEPGIEATATGALLERDHDYYGSLTPREQERHQATLEGEGDSGAILLDSGFSIGVDGCIGEARQELLGDRMLEVFDTFHAVQLLRVDVWRDPTVQQALTGWQNCMLQFGYGFENPDEATNAGLQMRADNNLQPSADEFTLAAADADCRTTSGLIVVVEDALVRLNSQAVNENENLLATWAELEQFVVDRAGKTLGMTLAG
jgi:hypothetical protein